MPRVSQQHKHRQRTEILQAARRCFVRNGFHRTSMHDVCTEAGRSPGTVYQYFSSKDEMILAVATQNLADVTEALHTAVRSGGAQTEPGQVMATLLDEVTARHTNDQLATVALMVWSEALRNPELADRLRQAGATMTRDLAELVRERQTAGAAPALPAEAVAKVILAVLPGYLLNLALLDPGAPDDFPGILRALWPNHTSPGDQTSPVVRPGN
ncbi:TetR/AcrR family transcriptional regulator [Streptomyces sp. NPDC050997]|uniref:TetR/AcrR family transcriptional regulator n=1 Tax=Streptomyces sp. NPDC050997 TaxID=3155519 RepID=UPI00342C2B7C